jgi:hypothetical protein
MTLLYLTSALGPTIPEVGLASLPQQLNMGVFSKTKVRTRTGG